MPKNIVLTQIWCLLITRSPGRATAGLFVCYTLPVLILKVKLLDFSKCFLNNIGAGNYPPSLLFALSFISMQETWPLSQLSKEMNSTVGPEGPLHLP